MATKTTATATPGATPAKTTRARKTGEPTAAVQPETKAKTKTRRPAEPATATKLAAPVPATPKKTAAPPRRGAKPAAVDAPPPIPILTPDQRRYYVEVAAYYIAERRGFHGGSQMDDWVAAEAEIDRLLREGILKP